MQHIGTSIVFFSFRMTSFRAWMLDAERFLTCHLRIPHRCSVGFRLGDILGYPVTLTLFFFRNASVAVDVCFGSLPCWKSARQPSKQILDMLFCAWVLGEASFRDDTHACHSSAVWAVWCHFQRSLQFGFLPF